MSESVYRACGLHALLSVLNHNLYLIPYSLGYYHSLTLVYERQIVFIIDHSLGVNNGMANCSACYQYFLKIGEIGVHLRASHWLMGIALGLIVPGLLSPTECHGQWVLPDT